MNQQYGMNQYMIEALEARNIDYEIIQIDYLKHFLKQRTGIKNWVKFNIGGYNYCNHQGILLREGMYQGEPLWHNINHNAAMLCADKFQTKIHLEKAGFSTPKGQFFRRRNKEKAYEYYKLTSGKQCVKPNNGSQGKKVFTGIEDEKYFRFALDGVSEQYKNIVVEDHVEGRHFRFFYVYPNVIGIREGVRMHVIGDGQQSIGSLLEEHNLERRKRALDSHKEFMVTKDVIRYLQAQNLTLDDVPAKDETVYLSGTSNGSAGAITLLHDLNDVHPSYLEITSKACQSFPGLYFSGVDLVIQDLQAPAIESNHWFLEFNTLPSIKGFYHPWEGEVVDIASFIVDFLINNYQHPMKLEHLAIH